MKRNYLYFAVDTYDRVRRARPKLTLGRSFKRNAARCSLLLTLIFLFGADAYLQTPKGLTPPKGLGENALLLKVQKRFKLSAEEVKNIRPRISEESQNVLRIFTRFAGDGYSPRLWYEVADGRLEFEKTLTEKLTNRQRAALRAARTDMEE